MEFTVSRADLVRELNLSQGVVEKKTTIPILSNVLVEADTDRIILTATDLELGIRCSCSARVSKPGSGTIPAKKLLDYVRLLPDTNSHSRYVSRKLPGASGDVGSACGHSGEVACRDDSEDDLRDLGRGI